MKRFFALLLAVCLWCSTLVFGAADTFAATRKNAAQYRVGDTFTLQLQTKKDQNFHSGTWKDAYYAKFVPASDGLYEFDVQNALDFYGQGGYYALITDAKDNPVSFAYALGEDSFYIDLVGNLKAGKTYYYQVMYFADVQHSVKLKIKLKKHKHRMVNTETGSPDAEYMLDYTDENGNYIDMCRVQGCYADGLAAFYGRYSVGIRRKHISYNGKERKVGVVFYDPRGKEFVPDDADTVKVKYENNVQIGTAKMKVKYHDYWYHFRYQIVPKETDFTKLTPQHKRLGLRWKAAAKQVSGYQIQISTSKQFAKKKTKTVTVKGRKNSSTTLKQLKSGKRYYVRIRTYKNVNGKPYRSFWSKPKKVTVG